MDDVKIILSENKLDVLRDNNDLRKMEIVIRTKDYFSITGTTWEKGVADFHTSGCIHEDILETIPNFKQIVDLHLSDLDGVPMHSVENGWYWAGGTRWNTEKENDPPNVKHLASHLRIDENEAQNIVDKVLKKEMTKEDFSEFVKNQKTRWNEEAVATLKSIEIAPETVKQLIEERRNASTFKM